MLTDHLAYVEYLCKSYMGEEPYEDMRQEFLLYLHNKWQFYDEKKGKPTTWIKFKFRDFLYEQGVYERRQGRMTYNNALHIEEHHPEFIDEITESIDDDNMEQQLIEELMRWCSQDTREYLTYKLDNSPLPEGFFIEIGKRDNVAPTTVRYRIDAEMRRIRKILEE